LLFEEEEEDCSQEFSSCKPFFWYLSKCWKIKSVKDNDDRDDASNDDDGDDDCVAGVVISIFAEVSELRGDLVLLETMSSYFVFDS